MYIINIFIKELVVSYWIWRIEVLRPEGKFFAKISNLYLMKVKKELLRALRGITSASDFCKGIA